MKNTILLRMRKLSGLLLSLSLLSMNYMAPFIAVRDLKDVHIRAGERYSLPIEQNIFFSAAYDAETLEVMQAGQRLSDVNGEHVNPAAITIRLLGVLPVKTVYIHARDSVTLVPGGSSIGVSLLTRGALVVGLSNITLENGTTVSPSALAGIEAGDLIEEVNGIEIENADHLKRLCNESVDGVNLTLLRGDKRINATLVPALDPSDGQYRMGMWVRDSTAGVGTLSFYDPKSNWYGALGHAITDIDTRSNLTVRQGEIVESNIIDIVQGAQGEPGELRGTFNTDSKALGSIKINDEFGIFGEMYTPYINPLYPEGIPMAYPEEARVGQAYLLTTLGNDGIKAYECRILKVNPQDSAAQKGMVIEITDPALLKATGGIVQGMSGSPIIQNDKLIGVVTHVFINDPTKGYSMYAEWMQEQIA